MVGVRARTLFMCTSSFSGFKNPLLIINNTSSNNTTS